MDLAVLASTHFLLADLDGVLYRGNAPLTGAAEFVRWLQQRRVGYLFITNNSTRTPQQYVEKLARMGLAAGPEQILTSSLATRAYLESRAPRGTTVYLIGQRGLEEALLGDGYFVLDEKLPAYVVVGLDTHLTYDKLRRATLLIRGGARFIGTNPDRTFPGPEGITPGCGSILAALEAASDVHPTVIGKPERWLMEEGIRRLGADPVHTAIVGDRLDTDIAGGKHLGLTTLMVLTGVHGPADLETSPVQPDAVFADLVELRERWEAVLAAGGAREKGEGTRGQ
jgi:4-nitrophenyl phosphatase